VDADRVREAAKHADMVVTADGRVLAAPENFDWYRRRGMNLTVAILEATEQLERDAA
jgi:hypothetical protein